MAKCSKLRRRMRDSDASDAPSPFEILQELKIDELIAMDMEKALKEQADPFADTRTAQELADKAAAIYQAALKVPQETQEKLWPETVQKADATAKALSEVRGTSAAGSAAKAAEAGAPGLQRAQLKATVFEMLDEDGDGYLYCPELRRFAAKFGFDGSDAEWEQEYEMLCTELGCQAVEGLTLRAFSRMLDDESGCYLSDEELIEMLGESNRLPRAGS